MSEPHNVYSVGETGIYCLQMSVRGDIKDVGRWCRLIDNEDYERHYSSHSLSHSLPFSRAFVKIACM